jgi:hypothetical protein
MKEKFIAKRRASLPHRNIVVYPQDRQKLIILL